MEPKLYILMRTDMDSMNAGKGMAQAAHAGTIFMHNMMMDPNKNSFFREFNQWHAGRGFGTKIVLGIPGLEQLEYLIDTSGKEGYHTGYVEDPTYPLKDGRFTHYIPVVTCGYIFDHNGMLNSNSLVGLSNYKLR